jgi:hypothetical protein
MPHNEFGKDKTRRDGRAVTCRTCLKEYYNTNRKRIIEKVKAWYEINQDQVKQRNKIRYQSKRATIHQQQKIYRDVNKEKVLLQKTEYRKKYKEEIRMGKKIYRSNHKEAIKEEEKEYRRTHKERFSTLLRNRRVSNPIPMLLSAARSRAKKKNLEFNIDASDVIIPPICPIFGIPLIPGGVDGSPAINSPSIDRVDNTKGYIKGNIRVISYWANSMKRDCNIEILEKVLAYMKAHREVAHTFDYAI